MNIKNTKSPTIINVIYQELPTALPSIAKSKTHSTTPSQPKVVATENKVNPNIFISEDIVNAKAFVNTPLEVVGKKYFFIVVVPDEVVLITSILNKV